MKKQYPPAPGRKKLTLAQITRLDNLAYRLSKLTEKTGREAEIIIKIIKGNPRILGRYIEETFDPEECQSELI